MFGNFIYYRFRLGQIMDRCFHQSLRVLGIPPDGVLGRAVPIIADIFGEVYPQIHVNTQKVKLYTTG